MGFVYFQIQWWGKKDDTAEKSSIRVSTDILHGFMLGLHVVPTQEKGWDTEKLYHENQLFKPESDLKWFIRALKVKREGAKASWIFNF